MTQVLIPFIAVMLNILVQVIICRHISSMSLMKSAFIGFFTGLFAVALLETYIFFDYKYFSMKEYASLMAVNLAINSILGYWYLIFITISHTALRTRLLMEIHNSDAGLTSDQILQRYNSRDIVKKRIMRLINNKQLICKGDRYFIGRPWVLWYAKLFQFMRHFILGEKGKYDFGAG